MNTYFYLDSENNQHGPSTPEQLHEVGIRPDTKVWCAGMTDWTDARNVEEIAVLFNGSGATVPPAAPSGYGRTQSASGTPAYAAGSRIEETPVAKPDSWLAWSIIVTIFCCLPFGIVAIVFAAKVDGLWQSGRYQDAVHAAKQARTWTLVGAVSGLAAGLIYFILMFMGMTAGWFAGMSGM